MPTETKRSMCFWCKPRCLLDVYIKDNRLEGVSQPPIKGCPRWRKAKEIFYHPERLRFPLKRTSQRGENKWTTISWDQALDEIAYSLGVTKEKYGAEGVAITCGTSRTYEECRTRFLNIFGSPNQVGQFHI